MKNNKRINRKKSMVYSKRRAALQRKSLFCRFFIGIAVITIMVTALLFTSKNTSHANETDNGICKTKYYKTIEIKPGETLWSIAREYKSGEYRTVNDYIEEVMSINNLARDDINSGEMLVVPYFE